MKIKAGIFDLGKVVVYSDDKALLENVKKTLNLNESQLKEVAYALDNTIGTGKITEDDFLRDFLKKYSIKKVAPKKLFPQTFEAKFRIFEDTIEIIKKLKVQGLKIAALSNTNPQHVEVMKKNGVLDYFDISILSCEVGFRKPDPRIYELALDKLGVLPNETFFTDDKVENIKSAQELGIRAFLFKNPEQLKKDLGKIGLVV